MSPANAEVLLPILVPESVDESLITGRLLRTLPPIQLITANSESKSGQNEVHASVTFGNLTLGSKSALIFTSDGFPTVTEAFRELLAISGRLITKHYTSDRKYAVGVPEKIKGGGYFTTIKCGQDEYEESSTHNKNSPGICSDVDSNDQTPDIGSAEDPSPNNTTGQANPGYKRKLTAARKAHQLSLEPNASFSFPGDDKSSFCSSSSATSTIGDDSPIFSTWPANNHSPDSSDFPFRGEKFIRSHSRTSSVSSITADAGGRDRKEANSTFKKMRYFQNFDCVNTNIAMHDQQANMERRKPSKPEFRPEYIDDFLSPNTNDFTIVHPPAPRNYINEFLAQCKRDRLHKDCFNDYDTARDW